MSRRLRPRAIGPWLLLALSIITGPAVLGEEPAASRAADWQVRQGKWRFEPDGAITCEGSVMSSLLQRKAFTARDLELSVQVMYLGPNSSAGVYFRSAGASFYGETTFYQFEWYTPGRHHDRRLSLMVKSPRSWKQIVVPIIRETPYQKWIQLRVRAEGDHLEAFVDGKRVFEKRDRTYLRAGTVGLHVFHASAVRFRDFRVKHLPADAKGKD